MTTALQRTSPPLQTFAARADTTRLARLQSLFNQTRPGYTVMAMRSMGPDDTAADDETTVKAAGYGRPILVTTRAPSGARERFVLHTVSANPYGHDRRADRAAAVLLAFDTFDQIPLQVPALHVGAFRRDDTLLSLDDVGELFFLTGYAEGQLYADELRAVAQRKHCRADEVRRAGELGRYLANLHQPLDNPAAYRRAIRDSLGSGEGIFGIIDGYPSGVAGASQARLQHIEEACLKQRWLLRDHTRLVRTHGDFHPFNILFDDIGGLALLDASRGCVGDPADDVTALAINYLFFALQHPGSWEHGFRPLWRAFYESYFEGRADPGMEAAAPMFFAWRALVLCGPAWYPDLTGQARDTLLGIAETALARSRFDFAAIAERSL